MFLSSPLCSEALSSELFWKRSFFLCHVDFILEINNCYTYLYIYVKVADMYVQYMLGFVIIDPTQTERVNLGWLLLIGRVIQKKLTRGAPTNSTREY